jgi:hypothetical protein
MNAIIRKLIAEGKIRKGMTLRAVLGELTCPNNIYQTRRKHIWTWSSMHFHFTPKRRGQDCILMSVVEDLI